MSSALVLGCGSGDDGATLQIAAELDPDGISARLEDAREKTVADAYRDALAEADAYVRHLLLADVYSRMSAESVPSLRDVFEEDLDRRSMVDAEVLGNAWAKLDPKEALSEVMLWSNARARKAASDEIMRVWVDRENADAARAALEGVASELPVGVVQLAQQSLAEALGHHGSFDKLIDLLLTAEPTDHRNRLIASATIGAARADRMAWIRFAESVHRGEVEVPDPELRHQLVLQAMRVLVRRDIQEAVEWYPTVADGESSEEVLAILAEKWGREDPEACLAFLRSRPESESPGMAKRALAFVWLQKDGEVASKKLRVLIDEDPTMDPTIFPLTQYLMAGELEESMELAQRVSDPREREIVLKQGLVRWARRDPAGVDGYLERYEVSPTVRTAVRLAKQMRERREERQEAE